MRNLFIAAGFAAILSAMFWTATGYGWWAPITDTSKQASEFFRGVVLFTAHLVLAVVGAIAATEPPSRRRRRG